LNHSSLSDTFSPVHGIYTYHCRDSKNNCKGKKGIYSAAESTYMSEEAKNKLKDFLFSTDVINKLKEKVKEKAERIKVLQYILKLNKASDAYNKKIEEFEKLIKELEKLEESKKPEKPVVPDEVKRLNELKKVFYNKKEDNEYTANDYNFYDPYFKDIFKTIINDEIIDILENGDKQRLLYQITSEMDQKNYNKSSEDIKTLRDLITEYIKNDDLDEESINI
jgi:hypothetical protein